MRRMSSSALATGVILSLAGAGMAACDEDGTERETRFQCAYEDEQGNERAVDCDQVNDNDGTVVYGGYSYPVFIHSYPASGYQYTPGQTLPRDSQRVRIGYKDAAGRQQWGLPATGRIQNNMTKTNVIGKGGAPVKGGSGGARGGSGGKAGG